jgi:hypothetical protein
MTSDNVDGSKVSVASSVNKHAEGTPTRGALADQRRDPREEQMTVTMAQKVSGPEHILQEVAETANGDELDFRLNKGKESRGSYYDAQEDYDWARDPDVGPNRRHGETLAAQERRLADEQEMARHSAVAREAHEAGLKRAASSRVQCAAVETWHQRTTTDESPTVDSDDSDPRGWLTQEELAAVNRAAAKLADKYGAQLQMGRAGISRLIAQAVLDGGSSNVLAAVQDVQESLTDLPGVVESLADLNPYTTGKTTVEGVVDHLFEIPGENQYQAGYLNDEGTRRKFVYWNKSKKADGMPTIREGDQVRFEEVSVNVYEGQACLAITGDTEIVVRDCSDGPKHRVGRASDPHIPPAFSVDSDTHAWVRDIDVERARYLLDD